MTIRFEEVLVQCRIERTVLETWIAREWVLPTRGDDAWLFSETDVARIEMICDLSRELELNEDAIDVVLRPGEMSLHHTNIVHGSNQNTSDGPRIGFIVRFVTNRTPNRDRLVVRARGNADCSHLRLASAPVNDDMEAAIAEWSSVARQS